MLLMFRFEIGVLSPQLAGHCVVNQLLVSVLMIFFRRSALTAKSKLM